MSSNQHSELVERVKAALAGSAPAPWTWDEDWDTLKSSNGRYVLASRLDFHGKDENGEDEFTSHIDVGDGDELIALAPEIATAYLGLFEQLEALEQQHDNLLDLARRVSNSFIATQDRFGKERRKLLWELHDAVGNSNPASEPKP